MYSVVLVMALAGGAEAPDCHSCHGGRSHGCHGGGYGGCYGGGYGGCYGGGYTGCYGGGMGYGGMGYGGGMIYGPGYGGGYGGAEKLKDMPKVDMKNKEQINAPANIVVSMPAGAKLSIDGYVSTQTSSIRQLVTPVLPAGQEFVYTLVAETTQNGQPVVATQKVTVRAGQTTPVSFTFSTAPAAASR